MTPEWIDETQCDLRKWDALVERNWRGKWKWNETEYFGDRGLTYGGDVALNERPRRASTGERGRGSKPPRVMRSYGTPGARAATKIALPVHLWAMLVRGREVESVKVTPLVGWDGRLVKGIAFHERWREYDGERNWSWSDTRTKERCDAKWTEHLVQRMVWMKRDGRWYGTWTWAQYDRDNEWEPRSRVMRMHPTLLAPAVHAGVGSTIPQEVLLGLASEFENWAPWTLAVVALTCRVWHEMCAPAMFEKMRIRSSRADEFAKDLARPHSHIPRFALSLVIEGPIPWIAVPKVLKLLPRVQEVEIEVRGGNVTTYNPTLPRRSMSLRPFIPSSRISTFKLSHQQFWSTADILQLVTACPQIASLSLGTCTAQTRSTAAPSVRSTYLTNVFACPADSVFCSLVLSWQWPHPADDPTVGPFPGISTKDAGGVAALLQCLSFVPSNPGTSTIYLRIEKSYRPNTWVLSSRMYFTRVMSDPIEIEVHVVRSPTQAVNTNVRGTNTPASIRHVVIRLGETPVQRLTQLKSTPGELDRLSAIDIHMSRYPRLQTVVLETAGHIRKSDILADQLEFLRSSGRVRQRTCDQAQRIAREATDLRRPQLAAVHDGEAVSPLWYEEQYDAARRKWLSASGEGNQT